MKSIFLLVIEKMKETRTKDVGERGRGREGEGAEGERRVVVAIGGTTGKREPGRHVCGLREIECVF